MITIQKYTLRCCVHLTFISLFVLIPHFAVFSQEVFEGFEIEPLNPVGELLSGITPFEDGILVCEYDPGRILYVSLEGEVEVLIEDIETPVDVELVNDSLWVLLEEPGELVEIDLENGERNVLVEGLFEPTAFAIGDDELVYVIEFFTGQLIVIDLENDEHSVLHNRLDNPADLAYFEETLFITQQEGFDLASGSVLEFSWGDGFSTKEFNAIDPTGIAVTDDGEIVISSFFIRECDSGGLSKLEGENEEDILTCDLTGPTSLTILPDGMIAVIEETTNSVVLVFPDGSKEYLVQGNIPIHDFDILPDGEIVIAKDSNEFFSRFSQSSSIFFLEDHEQFIEFDFFTFGIPEIEVGGDGNLYVYILEELFVYSPEGELIHFLEVFDFNRMLSDPEHGVAIIAIEERGFELIRIDASGIRGREPIMGDPDLLYIYPNGELGTLEIFGERSFQRSILPVAFDNQNQIWIGGPNTLLYVIQNGMTKQLVTEFDEQIVNIEASNEGGVIVGTISGKFYHVFSEIVALDAADDLVETIPAPPEFPETEVSNWLVY